jgi:hypothetical protein
MMSTCRDRRHENERLTQLVGNVQLPSTGSMVQFLNARRAC